MKQFMGRGPAGLIAMFGVALCAPGAPLPNRLVGLEGARIDAIVEREGGFSTGRRVEDVERDSTGSGLVVTVVERDGKQAYALIVRAAGPTRRVLGPAHRFKVDDAGSVVAWFESLREGVSFATGERVRVTEHGALGFTPGAEYFFVEVAPGQTEIRRTRAPLETLATVPVRGDKLFLKQDRVLLFSRRFAGTPGDEDYVQNGIVAHIFRTGPRTLELERTVFIPRPKARSSPYGVLDLDPLSDLVLIAESRDPPLSWLSSWYLFDMRTERLIDLGRRQGRGLFLTADPLRGRDE